MKKRVRKRKGFTLVELIIVMALFSLVMYSVVQLLGPVSKFFVRSSNFESTTACVDNLKRGIEGNLKYADRVRVYYNYNPYQNAAPAGSGRTDYTPSDDLMKNVNQFYTDFFMNRQYVDCRGKIYAMVFDNTAYIPESSLGSFATFSDFNAKHGNAGQIVLYEFNFEPTDGLVVDDGKTYNTYFKKEVGSEARKYTVRDWYINQMMYGNYQYQFKLGNFDEVEYGDAGAKFDPSACTVTIDSYEMDRDGGKLSLNKTPQHYSASFAMKNVLDATVKYTAPLDDFKTIRNPSAGLSADDRYKKIWIEGMTDYSNPSDTGTPIPRFTTINKNESGANTFTGTSLVSGGTANAGFYFIFTLPETTYNDVSSAEFTQYMEAVNKKYPAATTPAPTS